MEIYKDFRKNCSFLTFFCHYFLTILWKFFRIRYISSRRVYWYIKVPSLFKEKKFRRHFLKIPILVISYFDFWGLSSSETGCKSQKSFFVSVWVAFSNDVLKIALSSQKRTLVCFHPIFWGCQPQYFFKEYFILFFPLFYEDFMQSRRINQIYIATQKFYFSCNYPMHTATFLDRYM